ncbi:MAG: amidohydrolase family protein, partial [Phycisphaerales bacterium]|nr:amidohydrolase family protein [Phycisphaerales bacterium]
PLRSRLGLRPCGLKSAAQSEPRPEGRGQLVYAQLTQRSSMLGPSLPLRVLILVRFSLLAVCGVTRADTSAEKGGHVEDRTRPAAIMIGRYVAPDGSLQPGAIIEISRGKISGVAAGSEYENTTEAVRFENAVACPGLIDARSSIGVGGNSGEEAFAIDPGASAVDALDRRHRDFQAALRAGVTTAVLLPTENNLVSGAAAVVKTAAVAGDGVLRRDGPLVFSLSSHVWEYDRAPTSRIGSLAMLRDALEDAKAGRGGERMRAFVGGALDGLVACESPMDASAALRTFGAYEGRIAIIQTGETQEIADELATAKRAIVVGPYEFDMPQRVLGAAGALDAAGVVVAFAGDMPRHHVDSLRVTAALAVRYGMDPAAARRAMTGAAAEAAGVANRIGSIAPGRDADLVIFSDDPLRLDARVLAVYVDGVRVYEAGRAGVAFRGDGP